MKFFFQKIAQPSILHQSLDPSKSQFQTDPKVRSTLAAWLSKLHKRFVVLLTESYEIQIWQRTDRNGQIWWYVYDPRTQRSSVFGSELEVRVWIERQSHI